jgi:hypothetical protein
MTLIDFAADLLSSRGVLVDRDGEALEVVLPSDVARLLGLPEYSRLESATPVAAAPASHRLDYDAPLFDAIGRLLEPAGRLAFAGVPGPAKSIDAEAELDRALRLENGVWRFRGSQPASFPYVGFVLQYDLAADERTSGLVAVWVNAETRSFAGWGAWLLDDASLEEAAPHDGGRDVMAACWPLARAAALLDIQREVAAPLESLARRQARDLARMREYYEAIDQELRRKIARGRGRDPGADLSRLEATGRAFQAKARELVDRYQVRVSATPIAVVVCRVPGHRLDVRLLRRSQSADVSFAWNDIDGAVEARACDGCSRPVGAAWLCDDRVHYLCTDCLASCPTCAHRYCRACHARCPRKHTAPVG